MRNHFSQIFFSRFSMCTRSKEIYNSVIKKNQTRAKAVKNIFTKSYFHSWIIRAYIINICFSNIRQSWLKIVLHSIQKNQVALNLFYMRCIFFFFSFDGKLNFFENANYLVTNMPLKNQEKKIRYFAPSGWYVRVNRTNVTLFWLDV